MASLASQFITQFTNVSSAGGLVPNAAGLVYTYAAGTNTPKATYKDAAGTVPHTNPIVLDADGYPPDGMIYLGTGAYDFVSHDSSDALIQQYSNVTAPEVAGSAAALRTDLADKTSALTGAGMVGYDPSKSYASGTVGAALKRSINADDYATLGDAVTAAKTANLPLTLTRKTYTQTTPITNADVTIYGNGAVIDMSGMGSTDTGLTATGSVTGTLTVAANIAAGATSFNVTSSTGLVEGALIYLRSSDVFSTTSTITNGEWVRIKTLAGNTITPYKPIVYAYTTAASAVVDVFSLAGGFSWSDFTIKGSGSGSQCGARIQYATGVQINNVSADMCDSRGIELNRCIGVDVSGGVFSRANLAGYSYGIAIVTGCDSVFVRGVTGYDLRHCVTIGGAGGVNRNITVCESACHGARDAGFDSHPASDGIVFRDLFVSCASSHSNDAVITQGINWTIQNIRIEGTAARHGVFVQTCPSLPSYGVLKNVQGDATSAIVSVQQVAGSYTSLEIDNVRGHGTGYMAFIRSVTSSTLDRLKLTNFTETGTPGNGRGIMLDDNGGTISNVLIEDISHTSTSTTVEGIFLKVTNVITDVELAKLKLAGGKYNVRADGATNVTLNQPFRLTGSATSSLSWASSTGCKVKKMEGSVLLSAGTASVTLPHLMPGVTYQIGTSVNANETIRWSSKSATGFTLTSSNAGSTATVDYTVTM